ncbi:hypothetical protein FRACYDRAFT_234605 [Fragilariopsis cylindrus CCMP1102]|uniref:START domain-containing protein n=1 Tax=Fragilariopsis cylindrus CCMP1102 TaxID=635003 RepID=A0A1E7FS99_9STRA|nr:hypothetical protein FRACYDRAFT_234605 [Fragilariopsis cylindrus CCMP1102]|eukprot:OEU20975.1 hypothetical protein FRACYDRAFT_234605 [Fragilariopsis cylindrus CCMP1102]
MDEKRTKKITVLVWIVYGVFICLQNCCHAAVSGGGGGNSIGGNFWSTTGDNIRSSSFFGIAGNDDSSRSRSSSSSSYIRLGSFSLSREKKKRFDDDNNINTSIKKQDHGDDADVTQGTKDKDKVKGHRRRRLAMDKSQSTISLLASTSTMMKRDQTSPSSSSSTSTSSTSQSTQDRYAMTCPIIPLSISLDEQTGEEFSDPDTIDVLCSSGLEMLATDNDDNNDWIEWKMHDATKKLLRDNSDSEMSVLEQGEVMVYIGKAKQEGHGSKLPLIKTKSILPLSSDEMVDLLMDSSKVKIYNKLSVGRTDVKTLNDGYVNDGTADGTTKMKTKIVCNLTKPPIAKTTMVSCTMIHSRQLSGPSEDHRRCLVVSRATPGMITDSNMIDMPRNDILLGVNLLEDIKGSSNECIMTAVTHVYSPALPTILAKKMGVSSAINFVKDIRNSCRVVGS